MPKVYNTASAFTITQLTGPERSVRLVSRGLPYRPFNLKTTQRVEITWLPGSPIASTSVLGPTEEPTSVNGYWKEKYIGDAFAGTAPISSDGLPITTIRDAVQLFDSFVREGQVLEVSWDVETRHGYLIEFDKNYHNTRDLEWTMKFLWVSRGEPITPAVFTQEVNLSNSASSLLAFLKDLADFLLNPPMPIDLSFFKDITSMMAQITDSVQNIQDGVANMAALALSPFNALQVIVASTTALITQTADLQDRIEAQVAGALNYSEAIGNQTASDRSEADLYIRGSTDRIRELRYEAVDTRAVLLNSSTSNILGVYTAREGDDLRDVSVAFFGTPNDWKNLMLFNGLDSAALDAGQVVLVPKDPSQASGNAT
jgi:hypothetical protein